VPNSSTTGELVIVIGEEGRHIPASAPGPHLRHDALCNEGASRFAAPASSGTQGRISTAPAASKPWIVTSDECDRAGRRNIITRVNGEVRQSIPPSG
jgi:2-keto-4-pentenoate hydratase/2-oxohepta-3-ene-1,7-dioic acid hydratase in catechol pathway